jgi:stage V sporulation protein R
MMQASVMAHVVGHCEFSELNVMKDSNPDRTEYVMHLTQKVDRGRWQMGDRHYTQYWNACESITPMIACNSQFNLERTVDSEGKLSARKVDEQKEKQEKSASMPYSHTLSHLLQEQQQGDTLTRELKSRETRQALSRHGYKLRAPCQDVMGFLREYGPTSQAERSILDYLYVTHLTHDFIGRTQIMNEGWAMYWEKKIMLELFKEQSVKGIIDYSKVFAGVCYPRPYFQRNPYHLGYHMWCHIEELYRDGKVSLDFHEEKDRQTQNEWKQNDQEVDPIEKMTHLVKTTTDYEFLRRFLTPELTHEFHLNRIPKQWASQLGVQPKDVVQEDQNNIWLDPVPVKDQMLNFFTHMYKPRIYVIDSNFQDGGLLLFHRNDGRRLKKAWIEPTLKNINMIWKAPVSIYSQATLHSYSGGRYKETSVEHVEFDDVFTRMKKGEKPLRV